MIVKGDPNKKKPAVKTEDESKEDLLNELRKESLGTISLACFYVKKFEETGIDVTERWATAEQQSEIIQQFYYEGYRSGLKDGIEKGRQLEREEGKQEQQINLNFPKRHRSPTKKKRKY